SHAPGLFGMPSSGHCSRAATKASCARSSASPTSRTNRASPAMRRGASMRQTASMAGRMSGWLTERDRSREVGRLVHLVEIHLATADEVEELSGAFDGLFLRGDLEDRIARDQLFGLGEGAVGDAASATRDPHRGGLRASLETLGCDQPAVL